MELYQILANAKTEKKGNYKIYSYYMTLIDRAEDVKTQDEYEDATNRLRKILKI